jgi:hypothetical protein
MRDIPIFFHRKFFILKKDCEGDIVKIPIPTNISYGIGHLLIDISSPYDKDSNIFSYDSEKRYTDLFGYYIKDILSTETWRTNEFSIKIISYEDSSR